MKKIFTLLVLAFTFLSADGLAQSVTRIIGSSPFQDSLWVIDTTNWQVLRRLAPTPSSGGSFTGMNGIARNPVTGTIYVINKQSAVVGRVLGKLNPLTGLVTIVGNLGDNFATITFTGDQKLYGVTGDGATTPETLYQIDTATAAKRLVKTLGNGADGEVICWNSADNMLYHWSGNGTVIYEKMDTVTGPYNATSIPIIGTTNGETFGAVCIANNKFITSNISSSFNRFASTGQVSAAFGSNPDDLRGLALITCSRAITGAPQFCTGGNTTLTSGANYFVAGYQWYLNGVLIPSATSQSYVVTAPGHYNCIVSDVAGTDSTGTGVNVIENPLPTVTATSTASAVCAGSSITLTGSGAVTYSWTGGAIDGVSFVPSSTLTYTVTGTDANGCSNTATTMVTVNPLPVVSLGNDTATCATPVTLDAGNAGATYLWNDGTTTQTLVATTSGSYSVTVTDANGCSSNDEMQLTVNLLPVVNLGGDVTTCGTPVVLDAQNAGATYMWSDSTVAQTLTASTTGTYFVDVTDANGCSNSDTVMITVNTPPTVTISAPTTTFCLNDPPTPFAGSPFGGTFTGTGISGVTFTPSVAGAGTFMIYYMYTDSNSCDGSDSVAVTVNALPTVSLTATSNNVCFDDANVALTGTPAGGTFSGPGVAGNSFDPSTAGNGVQAVAYTYTDSITGCSNTTSIQITVNACVGITEHASVNGTELFPNPSNGNVQIVLTDASVVVIYNAIGEIVMSIQLADGTHNLDLTGFAEGVYVVRTENSKGVSTQRLMISK